MNHPPCIKLGALENHLEDYIVIGGMRLFPTHRVKKSRELYQNRHSKPDYPPNAEQSLPSLTVEWILLPPARSCCYWVAQDREERAFHIRDDVVNPYY